MRVSGRSPWQRIVSLALCLAMLLSFLPATARAVEGTASDPVQLTAEQEPVSQEKQSADPELLADWLEQYEQESLEPLGLSGITLPEYETADGLVSRTMTYDCGNGVTGDGSKSFLTVVTGTTAGEFEGYKSLLAENGYVLDQEWAVEARDGGENLFAIYQDARGTYRVYTYFFPGYSETRIIVDTEPNTVAGFEYVSETGETAVPLLCQYGLSISENGYDITTTTEYSTGKRNCGSLTVIRMADNSLFIHDGGDIEQWSDAACADFLEFCRELTGTGEGEKFTINTWFLSHAHTDHYLGFPRFVNIYHDAFEIKNIMYNIDIERSYTTRDIQDVMTLVSGYYPDVTYYKPHTGETLEIAGTEFQVLYTLEDRYLPNEAGELITDYPQIDYVNGKTLTQYDLGGTYRANMYESNGKSDFNDTSTVLKVFFENGRDAILYADMNLAENVLFTVYPDDVLATDIMMVPHHGHDSHPKLAQLSNADIFLYTQHKQAIWGADGDYEKADAESDYRKNLWKNYDAMKPYIEKAGSKTYWEGNETVCIVMDDAAEGLSIPAGMTLDASAPAGYTAYTAPARADVYTGWEVTDLHENADSINGGGTVVADEEFLGLVSDVQGEYPGVVVNTPRIRLNQVKNETLTPETVYAIVDVGSDKILMHDAVANEVSELEIGESSASVASGFEAYYDGISKLYIAHHDRDQALWIMRNIYTGGKDLAEVSTAFGGEKAYRYSMYTKGLAPEDGSYWYTTAADTGATISLQPTSQDVIVQAPPSLSTQNVYTEFFSDDTCVICYRKTDGTVVHAIYYDETNGEWARKTYKGDTAAEVKAAITADIEMLKLRLYSYKEYPTPEYSTQKVSYKGAMRYTVLTSATQQETVSLIVRNLIVNDDTRDDIPIPFGGDTRKVGQYWLEFPDNYTAGTVGDYLVKIQYRNDDGSDTLVGYVTVSIEEKIPVAAVGSGFGVVSQNAGVGAVPMDTNGNDCTITVTFQIPGGVKTENVKVTVGMLSEGDSAGVDTSVVGEHKNLTLTYGGQVITNAFTLIVSDTDEELNYPAYPEEGSVRVDKQGTTTEEDFSATGVANIQLSATGIPQEQGIDLLVVMDLSGSMEKGLDTNADMSAEYEKTRIYAMEQALKNMVGMMQDSGADIRIAMSDFGDLDSHEFDDVIIDKSIADKPFFDVDFNNTYNRTTYNADGTIKSKGYDFSNYRNFPLKTGDTNTTAYNIANSKFNLANPSYTGKVVPTIYTGSGEANAEAFVDVHELDDAAMTEIITQLNAHVKQSYGTNYDAGLEYAYQLGYAVQQRNIANGEDRKLVCIFLSDGAAMQYNYFSGRALSSTWADWITGRADGIKTAEPSQFEDELAALENALLALLKKGELIRPENSRDGENKVDGTYYFRYDPTKNNATAEHFYTVMAGQGSQLDWEYLCQIAEANGVALPDYASFEENYWEDGYESENTYWWQMKLPELRELLIVDENHNNGVVYVKDANGKATSEVNYYISFLKAPESNLPKFYTNAAGEVKYAGEETDFAKALEEHVSIELTYDLLNKIAYANREVVVGKDAAGNDLTVGDLLYALMTEAFTTDGNGYETLSPYAYFYNEDGKNWWAEAMKGDTDKLYPVINKYADHNSTERPFGYYGDVRDNFSGETTQGLALDHKKYIAGFKGLGMDIYTLSFSVAADGEVSSADAETVLRNIATGQNYFYAANTEESLTNALHAIITTASHAATRGWFQDTMGDDYDLSTKRTVINENGREIEVNVNPTIRVMEYQLDANGNRTGKANVLETVRFYPDTAGRGEGLKAWSDQVYTSHIGDDDKIVLTYSDIWGSDGVIRGKYFYYNTNQTPVRIDMTGDGVLDYTVPGETFLWVVGVIGKTEMVFEYQAYLTGSVEGTLRSDNVKTYYDTNEETKLTYINYLGNSCTQSVDTPKYPWITYPDGSLVNDKYVEATDDPNEFVLTLEAYAQGEIRNLTKPADIVLVLDHSGSMRTPVGAPGILQSGTLYTGGGEIPRSQISVEKARHRGYYVAQSAQVNENGEQPTYRWFIMEYVENYQQSGNARWVGYSVPETQSIVSTDGSYTEHTQVLTWAPGEVDGRLVFYKSQYAALYDTLLDFVGDLRESGVEHNVSIIGFAGSQTQGSRLYVGGDEGLAKTYRAMYESAGEARRTELYRKAPKNVQDDAEYAELLEIINGMETNHSFTCPSAGLQMASDLFAANEVDLTQRDRIVVLLTDGIPNKIIGGNENTSESQSQIFNEIVSKAYAAKQLGAQIYAISTTTLSEGADRRFLSYASSDYPNAVSYDQPGSAIASAMYTKRVENIDDFRVSFDSVTESTASVELDETAVLREVLTDYFVLNPDDTVDVEIYTAARKADGTFAAPVRAEDCSYTLSSSGNDGRMDTIDVTGYSYQDEYLSTVPRQKDGKDYYGSKLIVKVRVRTRNGFWGGNNVPTNEPATGIYDKNEFPVLDFPEPEVNVPADVTVTAKDKIVYYGDEPTASDLLDKVTAGGLELTINPDGTFTPREDWMDDFSDLTWTADSTKPGDSASGTEPKDYPFEVVLKPNAPATDNEKDPGNIAGDPVAPAGKTSADNGHIFVLVPEVTFRDSVTEPGTPTAGYDYENEDLVSVEWELMPDGKTPAADLKPGTAPKLELTFTPEDHVTEFIGDTKVEVTVSRTDGKGTDLDSVTDFEWDNCGHDEHGSCGVIGSHKADTGNIHEFWVHTPIVIVPDTVVIDFGLPVLIDPLTNDLTDFNVSKALTGIGSSFASGYTGTFGAAQVEGNEVRYTLNKSNGMQMDREETFEYQGKYTIKGKDFLADSTITVIPATIIYYEDSFVEFTSYTKGSSWTEDSVSAWTAVAGHEDTQATDRPGTDQIGRDTDNLYGCDGAYTDESGYSMASYHKFTADATHLGEASFTFKGTACDIIALSGGTTGTILVDVYEGNAKDSGKLKKSFMVDTYYGYKYENGEWTPTDPADPNALYQVPVMKVDMEAYGTYHVVITISYNRFFDHGQYNDGSAKYDFMLDAIRIYDQANDGKDNQVIEDAYVSDGEGWPSYTELRNILIDAGTFDSLGDGTVNGIVFIDGIPDLTDDSASGEDGGIFTDPTDGQNAAIADYANFGPNNELYLASGQGVSFALALDGQNVQNIHLALKSVGGTAKVQVYGLDAGGRKTYALGSDSAAASIATATDLYYDITALRGSKAIVIVSSGDAILSVTNIKMTHTRPVVLTEGQSELEMMTQRFCVSRDTAALALAAVAPAPVNPFQDVHEGDFYYDSVLWALRSGITKGVDEAHFGPGRVCNRAQVVTFLWRAAGCPEPNTVKHTFTDVQAGSFYYKAMLWALENGITKGVDDTHFAPEGVCSRAETVTFLWRAAGSPEPGVSEHPFADVAAGCFYEKATLWAVEHDITHGVAANSFGPALTCTRGQVVTFLYRAYTK